MLFDRREFLEHAALALTLAALPACAQGRDPSEVGPYADYTQAKPVPQGAGGYGSTTAGDIEGPFYRPNAPFSERLAPAGEPGRPLHVSGRVVKGLACIPQAGAVVDVWQATAKGRYDNDDPRNQPAANAFHLRGRVRTNAKGEFSFRTIWPGHYAIGRDRFRPAHLHVKASAKGCEPLTTQLYFKGDPHNAKDPWFDASRALDPKRDDEGVWRATYELVLEESSD